MKKFEYFICGSAIVTEEYRDALQRLGSEGWELVCIEVMYCQAVFKREIENDDE